VCAARRKDQCAAARKSRSVDQSQSSLHLSRVQISGKFVRRYTSATVKSSSFLPFLLRRFLLPIESVAILHWNRPDDQDFSIGCFGEASEPDIRAQVARTLNNKGVRFGQLQRSDQALVVYKEVIGSFGEACEPDIRVGVVEALDNRPSPSWLL
jgi:hypothetical protein